MNTRKFSDAMGQLHPKYVEEALEYRKRQKKPLWLKWGAAAASLCLVVTAVLFAARADGADNSEALFAVDTIPPAGLTLTIVDAAPDDAEFLITNNSDFPVRYGRANRVERYDSGSWTEVTTESAGVFPLAPRTIQPGTRMYGMCGWVAKGLTLEPGVYRYLLVVDIVEGGREPYPVVLKAEFVIE